MQNLSEIRELLASAGWRPRRRLGQHFLIDGNLMRKLLELAELRGDEVVLEVGAGTGSLTEELAARARRVVAVEVDSTLAGILRRRLADRGNVALLECDVLASKHAIAPAVLEGVRGENDVHLVANLPYHVAVPLIINCLLISWCWARRLEGGPALGRRGDAGASLAGPGSPRGDLSPAEDSVCFRRMSFTVQRELAERLAAGPGGKAYGPASIIVALLAQARLGRPISPESFWPRPKVSSQMLRLDFDADRAARLADAGMLSAVLSATFGQRRKKIAVAAKRRDLPFEAERFQLALGEAGIDPSVRPEQLCPEAFRALANAMGEGHGLPESDRMR